MGFEIDFLPVEAGEKSGDAIALKIWNGTTWWVVVIDGGYTDDGDALVDHINRYYGTNQVNLVILTHPDADHASGLLRVVERMRVDELWMHQPWNRVTTSRLQSTLRRDLDAAKALETAAQKKGIPITQPFSNTKYQDFIYVIGPTEEFYQKQLADFDCVPTSLAGFRPTPLRAGAFASLVGYSQPPSSPYPTLGSLGYHSAFASLAAKREDWHQETLDDDCDTSAENNTSVILAVKLAPDYWGMFTGDAGEPALIGALDWLDQTNFSTSNFKFVQIPHHGSEHNISPAVLNRWLGPPQISDVQTRTAFVSSARKAPKHPSDKVMNAFRRRGALPYATEGESIRWRSQDAPARNGWIAADPYPFHRGAA
jgi:beta-lactamase superfamily II metal-dependent hydrolase